jgi:hypothetical protein
VLTHRTTAAFLLIATLGLGWSARAAAATLTFPSATAPCNGTLQACIDGAGSGDRIEIASANRIEENITISSSVTLTGARGVTPVIGSADPASSKYLDVSGNGQTVNVELRGLKLEGAYITAYFGLGNGNALTIADCEITNTTGSTSNRGIDLDVRAPGKIRVEHNVIHTDGYGISLYTGSAGEGTFDLVGNSISGGTKGKSASGIDLSLRGAGKVLTNVADNVIFSVADCNCGGAAGIEVGALESAQARVFLTNNTLVGLPSATGISIRSPEATSSLETYIFNNIVSNAEDAVRFPSALPNLTITDGYNDFFGSLSASYVGGYPLAATDLAVDPGFVDRANHDYRLTASSPLVEAAMSLPPGGLPAVDADDHVRLVGAGVDLGAYETGAVASSDLALKAETTRSASAAAFTLHVSAVGPSVARDVSVSIPLPKGASFVSAKTTLGTCSGTDTVTCALDRMPSGSTATITVLTTLAELETTEATIARVSSATADPVDEDNTATLSLTGSRAAEDGAAQPNAPTNTAEKAMAKEPAATEGGCSMSARHATTSSPAALVLLCIVGVVGGRKRRDLDGASR